MCKAASFIVVNGEPPKWSRISDSHEVIRKEHELPHNTDTLTANVQVEITPPNDTDYDAPLSKWVFRVDQDRLPKWWDAKVAEIAVRKELKAWAKCKLFLSRDGMIVDQQVYVMGSSRVEARGSSRVVARDSSRVEARGSSRVVARDSSRVEARDSSRVVAWGSSRVEARDSSRVEARDSSRVVARDSSRVVACESSSVEAWESSSVSSCSANATVTFYCKFSCKLIGKFAVIINRCGKSAKCHVGSDVERVITDRD